MPRDALPAGPQTGCARVSAKGLAFPMGYLATVGADLAPMGADLAPMIAVPTGAVNGAIGWEQRRASWQVRDVGKRQRRPP